MIVNSATGGVLAMLTSCPCLTLLTLLAASPVTAQVATRFTIGGRDIVRVDIAGTAVGDFPAGIQMIDGIMEVIDFKGQRMLRASSRSSFLVRLPQVLPQDFTLEFEIVPKVSGNPEDLAVEGTPQINQGASSANVMWHRDYLQIVGGGPTYDSKVPESFAAGLPGVLTHIAITVQGPMMKLHTNGRLMFTQQRQFVRGRVLRIFLGGQDDGPNAVYLASMRVVDAVGPVGPLAGGTGTTTSGSGRPRPDTTSSVGASTGSMTNTGSGVQAAGTGKIATTEPPATSGGTSLAPRTIPLPGFTASGSFAGLAPRTIALSGFTASGSFAGLAPRTIALSGFTATGSFASLTPRTIALSGFSATGSFASLAPRTIALSGFTATGSFASLTPRTITLSGFTAAGSFPSLAPRTVTLPGFTAAGSFITLPPRTITLSGWTAVGVTP